MTQELLDLRISILEGRYEDALQLVDELEAMSKKAILRNIASFLIRLSIYLIKNQIEQRLTNSWIASISDSILEIQSLNTKENKKSYYIQHDEWQPFLEEAIERAIRPASVEVLNGSLKPSQLAARIERNQIVTVAQQLINSIYEYSAKDLPAIIDQQLAELPGGKEWFNSV